jgi:endonuclease-8
MPEGDTIHRAATALRAALVGRVMTGFEAPRHPEPWPAPGRVVERVDARGKHLDIVWDDGMVLHTHMRMTGSWHLYRPGERWRKPYRHMRVVIEVGAFQAVCFNAPVVELYRSRDAARHPGRGPLGPDLCVPGVDLAECFERMAALAHPDRTIAEVLLDQRIACGVGNVYKSEVLWACGVDPFTPAGAVGERTRRRLLETAALLLQANLDHAMRVTVPAAPDGLAVYGRHGKPCLVCHTPVDSQRHGEHARVTYWCPSCQARDGRRPGDAIPADQVVLARPGGPVAPPLDPHPASTEILGDFRPRGPKPVFVDPLLDRDAV